MRHRCARKELGSETHADVASVIQAPVTVEGKSKVFSLATGIFSPQKAKRRRENGASNEACQEREREWKRIKLLWLHDEQINENEWLLLSEKICKFAAETIFLCSHTYGNIAFIGNG